MHYKDFSLLIALDVLLAEESVAAAAERLHISSSAMSRILSQIRLLFDDPILVRAGQRLCPTAKAESLRPLVREIAENAHSLLASDAALDMARLDRVFTIRATDSFVAAFGLDLTSAMARQAPLAKLRFLAQGDENVDDLREGLVDFDIGVLSGTGPELLNETLFEDRFIGVVRAEHPFAEQAVTPERFAGARHISVSRRGLLRGPLDTALEAMGLFRNVPIAVPTFADAILMARASDLVASMPERLTREARRGMFTFPLPVTTPPLVVSMAWHPRFESDAAHCWFRGQVHRMFQPA
ncbi:LysR family transcriptional regulator [Pseudodesulfovibrio sp.]|uniref:LysR family transcriptional regulator n=1 Tax=unclassified Pseudodesulfovibrio TaxID=2661612 RepID=UPI003AFF66BD